MPRCFSAFLSALLLTVVTPGYANTTAGAASVQVIPIVVKSITYDSEIFVRNPNNTPLQVNVKFYEANNSATPGLRSCNPLILAAQQTIAMTLGTQCTLTGANSHFGMLVLENAASEKTQFFYAYSRTQNFQAIGFSVESYPIGNFSGQPSGVNGVKRQAATVSNPAFQTNCFVGALGEPVTYRIRLWDSSNNQVGNDVTGSLQPYEMIRYLDIFSAAGLLAGDYTVMRVTFNNDASLASLVGLCTVQENSFFAADVRVAKSSEANDSAKRRQICYSQTTCGTAITDATATTVPSNAVKNIHYFIASAPDYVKCQLVSPQLANLEMQVRGPGDTFASGLFVLPPGYTGAPYSAGGSDQTSFYIFTGEKNAFNGGFGTRLFIDVSYREGSGSPSYPIPYGITCNSGNGISVPWFRSQPADDF